MGNKPAKESKKKRKGSNIKDESDKDAISSSESKDEKHVNIEVSASSPEAAVTSDTVLEEVDVAPITGEEFKDATSDAQGADITLQKQEENSLTSEDLKAEEMSKCGDFTQSVNAKEVVGSLESDNSGTVKDGTIDTSADEIENKHDVNTQIQTDIETNIDTSADEIENKHDVNTQIQTDIETDIDTSADGIENKHDVNNQIQTEIETNIDTSADEIEIKEDANTQIQTGIETNIDTSADEIENEHDADNHIQTEIETTIDTSADEIENKHDDNTQIQTEIETDTNKVFIDNIKIYKDATTDNEIETKQDTNAQIHTEIETDTNEVSIGTQCIGDETKGEIPATAHLDGKIGDDEVIIETRDNQDEYMTNVEIQANTTCSEEDSIMTVNVDNVVNENDASSCNDSVSDDAITEVHSVIKTENNVAIAMVDNDDIVNQNTVISDTNLIEPTPEVVIDTESNVDNVSGYHIVSEEAIVVSTEEVVLQENTSIFDNDRSMGDKDEDVIMKRDDLDSHTGEEFSSDKTPRKKKHSILDRPQYSLLKSVLSEDGVADMTGELNLEIKSENDSTIEDILKPRPFMRSWSSLNSPPLSPIEIATPELIASQVKPPLSRSTSILDKPEFSNMKKILKGDTLEPNDPSSPSDKRSSLLHMAPWESKLKDSSDETVDIEAREAEQMRIIYKTTRSGSILDQPEFSSISKILRGESVDQESMDPTETE